MALHIRDHGGEGPPLVLLHGAGRSLADWDAVAEAIGDGYRVLALDLPGHGRSPGISPWSIPAVVREIAESLDTHGVTGPVLVGHSLGGMIAIEYARAQRVRAAVNLDGFWWGRPGEYPGAERVGALLRSQAGAVVPATYVAEEVEQAAGYGIPAGRAETAARAALRPRPDGTWQLLPERPAALEMYDEMDRIGASGVTAWLAGVSCPLLLVQAGRQPERGVPWLDELFTGFARGLAVELAALARERPSVTVARIDATHEMVLAAPGTVAALITGYLRGLPPPE
ncbi:alpha/beta hydrolase family protein [Nocardia nova SH22a]|uniref:Alpha/beta hydrolase family protein n=1 Tax=Nocardia nova SH22a TaxID=1415166 RepID=W5TG21_9NOCA|nr:alpha/beta hydrolase [Nocardia nova]AHH16201.1 alpha/beta hydrolase family protein [Nocardia nova SH22a]